MPGKTCTFFTTTTGNQRSPESIRTAPAGMRAILSWLSLAAAPCERSIRAASPSLSTSSSPKACAMPSKVRSSCVGPTPPDVKTRSKASLCARTSSAIVSITSGITAMRSTSTPSSRSSRQRYGELVSTTLPERISLPMTRMPAVDTRSRVSERPGAPRRRRAALGAARVAIAGRAPGRLQCPDARADPLRAVGTKRRGRGRNPPPRRGAPGGPADRARLRRRGLCGRCGVTVLDGGEQLPAESALETRAKQLNRVSEATRLACRVAVQGDLVVTADYW